MADDDGFKGLVDHEEIPETSRFSENGCSEDSPNEAVLPQQLPYATNRDTSAQVQDFIVSVFVVTFDTRKGWHVFYKYYFFLSGPVTFIFFIKTIVHLYMFVSCVIVKVMINR